MITSIIFAFLIAHCFVTVFEMTVDTIFICYCIDIEENDGNERPYYMSEKLRNVMMALREPEDCNENTDDNIQMQPQAYPAPYAETQYPYPNQELSQQIIYPPIKEYEQHQYPDQMPYQIQNVPYTSTNYQNQYPQYPGQDTQHLANFYKYQQPQFQTEAIQQVHPQQQGYPQISAYQNYNYGQQQNYGSSYPQQPYTN